MVFAVAAEGASAPAVFNAANEVAVEKFLAGRIKFGMIVKTIEHCLNKHQSQSSPSLDELLAADSWARSEARRYMEKKVQHVAG